MDSSISSLYDAIISDIGTGSGQFLEGYIFNDLSGILIAAFGITVAFVAYKLIKRALNKA